MIWKHYVAIKISCFFFLWNRLYYLFQISCIERIYLNVKLARIIRGMSYVTLNYPHFFEIQNCANTKNILLCSICFIKISSSIISHTRTADSCMHSCSNNIYTTFITKPPEVLIKCCRHNLCEVVTINMIYL